MIKSFEKIIVNLKKPPLIIGKGPTFSKIKKINLNKYTSFALNHAIFHCDSDYLYMNDYPGLSESNFFERFTNDKIDKIKGVVLPFHPKLCGQKDATYNLQDYINENKVLKKIYDVGKLFTFNIFWNEVIGEGYSAKYYPARMNSGDTLFGIFCENGIKKVYSIGIDGGSNRSKKVKIASDGGWEYLYTIDEFRFLSNVYNSKIIPVIDTLEKKSHPLLNQEIINKSLYEKPMKTIENLQYRLNTFNVIIVTYNSSSTIADCLKSVINNSPNGTRVTVVDNSSKDNTLNILESFSSIKIIKNSTNKGFSEATNQGFAKEYEYTVLLNPDTIVTENWLSKFIFHLQLDPKIAAVGPLSNYAYGKQNISTYYNDKTFSIEDYSKISYSIKESIETKLLIGFCILIRSEIFNKLGKLDKKLFLGNDDLDLSWRIRLNDYKLVVAKNVFIYHRGQVSFKTEKKIKTNALVQESSNLLMEKLEKHYGVNNVPTPQELWDIDWFEPSERNFNPLSNLKNSKENLVLNPKISIIILSFNAFSYTLQCVESVIKNTFSNYELIIFDNGSDTKTIVGLKDLQKKYPEIKIIFSKKNLGFAKGNNEAFKSSSGEYVCFVNNDTLLPYGWLTTLYNSLKLDNKIGAVGPVSNSVSGRQKITQEYELSDFFNYSKERIIKKNKITPRRRLAGLVVLLPRKIYQSIGGFSEDFKIGNYEDDDLSLKIRSLGYALMVNESVYVHHFGSQTFKANNIDYSSTMSDGESIFKRKWPKVNYSELLEIDNNLIDCEKNLIKQAFELLNSHHYEKALEFAEKIIKFNPVSEEALFLKSIIYTTTEKFESALETLNRLISINNTNSEAHNQLGIIYLFLSKTSEAIKCFDRAISLKPDWIEPYKLKSESLVGINEINKAYETLIEIVNIFGQDESILNRIVQILQIAGEKKEADKWSKILNSQSSITQVQEKFI